MVEAVVFYKGIVFLATCAVLAHCAIETGLSGDGSGDETEQYANNAEKSSFEPLTLYKRPSFFVGSRYGRSGAGTALSSTKIRRLNVVPRNDRFFLGSRYGKRAEGNSAAELFLPYEQQQTIDDSVNTKDGLHPLRNASGGKMSYNEHENFMEKQNQQQQKQSHLQSPSMMSCVFTGYRNYYRCRNIDEINNIINQLTVAHSIEDRD